MSKYAILQNRIVKDLVSIGVPVSFELIIKDYSKSFYGCYRPNTDRVYLYYYEDKECSTPYSYEHLFKIAVHESVHAIQWNDPDFVRAKGVMHNEDFHRMFEQYMCLAKELVFRERTKDDVEEAHAVPVINFKGRSVCSDIGDVARPSNRVLRVACRR